MKKIDKVILKLEKDLSKHKSIICELTEQLNDFSLYDVKSKSHVNFIREKNANVENTKVSQGESAITGQSTSSRSQKSLKKIKKNSSLLPSSRQSNACFLQNAILDEVIVISDDEVIVIPDDDDDQPSSSHSHKQSNKQTPNLTKPTSSYSNDVSYFNLRADGGNLQRERHVQNNNHQVSQVAKSQILKYFNKSTVFTAERIAVLINKFGLSFDEVKYWHDGIVANINAFHERCPNPCAEDFMLESTCSGVKVKILKNWSEIKKHVGVSENVRREVLELTKFPPTIRVNFNRGSVFPSKKDNDILEAFYLRNPAPSEKVKRNIARLLECEVDKIKEWFTKNENRLSRNSNENKKTNYYEIAVREIEAGFSLGENDVKTRSFPDRTSNTLTTADVEFLKDFFYNDPYPPRKMVVWVAHKSKHTFTQVKTWYDGMRKKIRKVSKAYKILL